MSCTCYLVAALQFLNILRLVTGEEFSYVARFGEDGIIHLEPPVRNEHNDGMKRIQSQAIIGFSVIGGIGAAMFLCVLCYGFCCSKKKREASYRSTMQRVNQQPIQLNVHYLQQPVTSLASQRVGQQPIQPGVHNLQQPVTPLASAPAVIHTERTTAPLCPDADSPPSYDVAMACPNYAKQIPYNSTYKQ